MRFAGRLPLFICGSVATLVLAVGCTSSNNHAATVAVTVTAPPPQSVVIRTATPSAPLGVVVPNTNVIRITNMVKLQKADLPPGFSTGQLEGYQDNRAAASGFDDYDGTVKRMDATGRLGGLIQGLVASGGINAGDSIDVWKDAQGCKQYFDQYPKPSSDVKSTTAQLPHPLGDQSEALHVESNGQTGYSIAWRRGRLMLGVGVLFPSGQESLDTVMSIADALDKKAQAASQ